MIALANFSFGLPVRRRKWAGSFTPDTCRIRRSTRTVSSCEQRPNVNTVDQATCFVCTQSQGVPEHQYGKTVCFGSIAYTLPDRTRQSLVRRDTGEVLRTSAQPTRNAPGLCCDVSVRNNEEASEL